MEALSGIPATWQTWAVDPLSGALTLIHDTVGSYALAIILFTIAIRVLMIPLTLRQIRSQRRMQLLQPEIAKLRKRTKGDRQKESQALMKLYRDHGVNPVSGCLPIFVQLPVLLALYGGILTLSGRGVLNEQFLWFNLAREDSTLSVVGETAPTEPVDVHMATDGRTSALESAIAVGFAQLNANYRFHVDTVESDQAIGALSSGAADAAFFGAPLDRVQLPAGTLEDRFVQSAALMVQVESPSLPTRLGESEAAEILRGDITNWADVGGLPGAIRLHTIRDDIGSRALVSELLLNGDPIARSVEHDTVDAYLEALRGDPSGLGLSMPLQSDDVRMLNIQAQGASRAFPPTQNVLTDGNYAIARDRFVYWTPARGDAGYDYLLRWVDSGEGQGAAVRAGFTQIPPDTGLFGSGGFYISVLALLAGGFQFIQARMMQQHGAEGQMATVNRVMQFMPLIVVVFAWTFQAGLVVYWVISSIIAIIQQYFTTGTGRLMPLHWPLARDVTAEHRAAVEAAKIEKPSDEPEEPDAAPRPRRRRRRRRRSG